MAQEEKPQEPLKTPCRLCKGGGELWVPLGTGSARMAICPTCGGSGYEEKP